MKYWMIIMLIMLLTASCGNGLFTPIIGKWQLKTVEKKGEITTVDTVWYSFQSQSVFGIQVYKSQLDTTLGFYGVRTQNDNVIFISVYIPDSVCYHTDWPNNERSFTIEKLDRKHLGLKSEEGYIYSFTKY